jgi:DNA gyrase/topoisomerase IV subunit B
VEPVHLGSTAPVRLRAGMYVGSTDARGLEHLVFEVVGNSIDQFLAGQATSLSVEVSEAGWVTVRDDGPGLPVEARWGEVDFMRAAFESLHTTATLDGHHPHVHLRSDVGELGLGVVTALSARFEVETQRHGVRYQASYERGQLVETLHQLGPSTERGSTLRFLPDPDLFVGAAIDVTRLTSRLQELAFLTAGLELRFQGRVLSQPRGLLALLESIGGEAMVPASVQLVHGEHEGVEVDVALGWAKGSTAEPVTFVNLVRKRESGSQHRGLWSVLGQDRGAIAVVHVRLLHPQFEGPTKSRLRVDAAQRAVATVLRAQLSAWWRARGLLPEGDARATMRPIREAPEQYVGQDVALGVLNGVLDWPLSEHLAGRVQRLDVVVEPFGWVSVTDDGPGLEFDTAPAVFQRLDATAPSAGRVIANALAERVEVTQVRGPRADLLVFERGEVREPLHAVERPSGFHTQFRYLLDRRLFPDATVELERVDARLEALTRLCPTLQVSLQGRDYPEAGSLLDWARELAAGPVLPGSERALHSCVDGIDVQVAWVRSTTARGPRVLAFINLRRVDTGGHVEVLLQSVAPPDDLVAVLSVVLPPTAVPADALRRAVLATLEFSTQEERGNGAR